MGSVVSSDGSFALAGTRNADHMKFRKLMERADIQARLQEDSIVVVDEVAVLTDNQQPSTMNVYGNYDDDGRLTSVEFIFSDTED